MRLLTRRTYANGRATSQASSGIGQNYGRQRLMPREVEIRRTVARWSAQQRQARQLLSAHSQHLLKALLAAHNN